MLASHDLKAANGTIVRYRELATESGQSGDDHAATRNGGGARIDGARANSSTMRIAAPQCGQVKVAVVMEACRGDAAVAASGTCNSSRA